MNRLKPRWKIVFAITGAVLLGSLAVTAALGASPFGSEPVVTADPTLPPSPPVDKPNLVTGPAADSFSILKEETINTVWPAKADAAPGTASALALILRSEKIDQSVAAHVIASEDGELVTVAAIAEEMCVALHDMATCGPPQEALAGRLVAVEVCSPEYPDTHRVLGMVPDGVTSVTINGREGSSTRIPVADNTYAARISVLPASFTWEGPGIKEEHPSPVRAGASPADCGR